MRVAASATTTTAAAVGGESVAVGNDKFGSLVATISVFLFSGMVGVGGIVVVVVIIIFTTSCCILVKRCCNDTKCS